MSEMELTILRQRAHEALKQKARRGELFTSVAIGYVRNHHDRIEKDPDLRVREALALVFRKFEELQSVRQVHLWFRQERILLPAVCYGLLAVWHGLRPPNPCRRRGLTPPGMFLGSAEEGRFFVPA